MGTVAADGLTTESLVVGNRVLMCLPCALSCPRSDPQTRVCHETDQGSLTESESPSSEKIQQPRDLISTQVKSVKPSDAGRPGGDEHHKKSMHQL